jgi:hypothetical protein
MAFLVDDWGAQVKLCHVYQGHALGKAPFGKTSAEAHNSPRLQLLCVTGTQESLDRSTCPATISL